jgi:hypothetical protein
MVLIIVVIVMDKLGKTNITNGQKLFSFPKIPPFYGPFQQEPEAVEIQISSPIGSRSLPIPPATTSQTHVAFSAGVITIISATIGTVVLTFIFQNTTTSSAFSGQSKSVRQARMHKGSVDHFGSLWPQELDHFAIYGARNKVEPFWQFMAPEIAISWQFMAPET